MSWSAIIMYDWVKAAHIIFVIFWMAGLFLLPRYYIYHQEALADGGGASAEAAKWVERERKLRNIIINPSMILVWVLGLALAYMGGWWTSIWFHIKFALVFGLSGYHGYMIGYGRRLAKGELPMSGKALRLMNEVPGVAIVIIVILVVVKPF